MGKSNIDNQIDKSDFVLTQAEVAKILKRSTRTVRKFANDPKSKIKLQTIKVYSKDGEIPYFSRSEVLDLRKKLRARKTPEVPEVENKFPVEEAFRNGLPPLDLEAFPDEQKPLAWAMYQSAYERKVAQDDIQKASKDLARLDLEIANRKSAENKLELAEQRIIELEAQLSDAQDGSQLKEETEQAEREDSDTKQMLPIMQIVLIVAIPGVLLLALFSGLLDFVVQFVVALLSSIRTP